LTLLILLSGITKQILNEKVCLFQIYKPKICTLKLITSESKDLICCKKIPFQINAVLLNYLFIKERKKED